MVNITNTKSCPYISPPCLRTNISPGLIFGGLQYAIQMKYLDKSIHSHNSHVRLRFSIIHQVQIHQFFQLQIISLHTVHNIREQRTKIHQEIKKKTQDLF